MSLKSDLRQLNTDLNEIGDNLSADLQRLEDKIANTPAAEDVSEELSDLRSTVDRLRGLDRPDPETVPDSGAQTPGVVVGPGVVIPGGEPAVDSPGETQEVEQPTDPGTVEDQGDSEQKPENV